MAPGRQTLGVIGLGSAGSALATAAVAAGMEVVAVVGDEAEVRPVPGVDVGTDPAILAVADIVVEAVPERLADKLAVLRAADRVCRPDTVFATSATALPVSEIAAGSGRPRLVAGFHPAPPAARATVELVASRMTAPTALFDLELLARRLGWTTVRVGDRPGRISGRLFLGYLNGAAMMVERGYASRDEIDVAMRLGCGLPDGPLAQIDQVGVDTICDALGGLAARTGNDNLRPAPILRRMVRDGELGRKSGLGFYDHREAPPSMPRPAPDGSTRRERVVIVGSGVMAAGVAEVCVRGGFPTMLLARSAEKADQARDAVATSLMNATARGKVPADQARAALARLRTAVGLQHAADADVVVETVVEDLYTKRRVFTELGRVCRPGTLLATCTSSLPVYELALASGRPEDVLGMHFFNPAPVMKLVEIITTPKTGGSIASTAQEFVRKLGKHGVRCADQPGFIVNALLLPYLNDAVDLLGSHYADIDQIDTVLRDGCGFPLGPFQLLDMVGLDVSLQIQRVVHESAPDIYAAPAALLNHLVAAGLTGRKVGEGFRATRR